MSRDLQVRSTIRKTTILKRKTGSIFFRDLISDMMGRVDARPMSSFRNGRMSSPIRGPENVVDFVMLIGRLIRFELLLISKTDYPYLFKTDYI